MSLFLCKFATLADSRPDKIKYQIPDPIETNINDVGTTYNTRLSILKHWNVVFILKLHISIIL